MTRSDLEATLDLQLRALQLPAPVAEFRFHPTRRWRLDRAWPDLRLAVEIDGGTWTGGRHVRPAGFEADCEKLNTAQLLGWRVLRVTAAMVRDGRAVAWISAALTGSMNAPQRG